MMKSLLVPAVIVSAVCCSGAAHAQKPGDCGYADALVTAKLRTLLQRNDAGSHDLASRSVPSLEQARALCAVPQVRTALKLYAQLLLDMEIQEASAQHVDGAALAKPQR